MEHDAPAALLERIELAQREVGEAIAELRELARGIHPAALTESGLPAALRGLALRSPLDVTVDVGEERLPESVEVAFYYVAAEALANVVKHAGARRVELTLRSTGSEATLRIVDDGVGGAEARPERGLAGLVDRLDAVGGGLTVSSAPGAGTAVVAVVPLR
jgi:signal transduction histidine kinase